jgi:DNA helicase-2/ATP-dependent DNA helicase PcrA
MDISTLISSLNEAQRAAVTAPLGHQLVLAGAGSGKTRVLTYRIAWLVTTEKISPATVIAVTFTNKAASEMRHRIEELLGSSAKNMWIGTFHNLSHRLLRTHAAAAGLPEQFQILDADDQYRLLKRIIAALNIDEDKFPPKEAQWFINSKKDEGLEAREVQSYGNPIHQKWIAIYTAYEEACQRAGLVDFADLLMKVNKLWKTHPELLAHYQQRFNHILVDEFQDTNATQYRWVSQLAGKNNFITIVGDDDQSIYGWRGAQVENLEKFRRDFPQVSFIRLEQNYRSTGTILKAANQLIANNESRFGKNLWTTEEDGEKITLYAAFNEFDEAHFIANRIRERQSNCSLREMAILYRSNAQSRVLEETLIHYGIPYRIYGGLRFFERAEIKDALAYLRLLANPEDDAAFERIINVPTRGIGDNTQMLLREHAKQHSLPLWHAASQLVAEKRLPSRATTGVAQFIQSMQTLGNDVQNLPLPEIVQHVVYNSGLIEHYRKEKGEKGISRIENLEELINAAKEFSSETEGQDLPPLSAFLAYSALEAGEGQAALAEDGVQLMTLHSAKGLEFSTVFLAGCEEGLFPHYLSQENPQKLEEERRLCYVGITRAMQKLFLSFAEARQLYGRNTHNPPSRFLQELPTDLIEGIRMKTEVSLPTETHRAAVEPSSDLLGLRIGQQVTHRQFGDGIILQQEGQGNRARLQIKFSRVGVKWLIASYVEPA